MCMVAYKLKKDNPVGLILAETLNGLDAFQRREASFFVRSPPLLCEKSSSSSGIIPNFCLGSQPSGIPLILHGLPFSFQPIEAPYIIFHYYYYYFFFSLMLFTSFFLLFVFLLTNNLLFHFFFFFNMDTREASVASSSHCAPQHLSS